jgi:hypothetical protein
MAAVEKMNWVESQGRWEKSYKKKRFWVKPFALRQLGYDAGDTKVGSRAAANAWFDIQREQRDAELRVLALDTGEVIHPIRKNLNATLAAAQPDLATFWAAADLREDQSGRIYKDRRLVGISDFKRGYYQAKNEARTASKPDQMVGVLLDRYLDKKKNLVNSKNRSADTPRTYKTYKDHAAAFIGRQENVSVITGATVENYNQHLHGLLGKGEIEAWTAHNRFSFFKSFIRWCWRQHLIDLPRNLDDDEFSFDLTNSTKAVAVPLEDIHKAFWAADDTQRLLICLAMNCGFKQKAIDEFDRNKIVSCTSDALPGQVAYRYEKYKRGKTKKFEGVPEVSYLLWPETVVFLNKVQLPRRRQIPNMFKNLNKAAGTSIKPMELRSTVNSLLLNNPEYAEHRQYFMGHSKGRSIVAQHYDVHFQHRIDALCIWIRSQVIPEDFDIHDVISA